VDKGPNIVSSQRAKLKNNFEIFSIDGQV